MQNTVCMTRLHNQGREWAHQEPAGHQQRRDDAVVLRSYPIAGLQPQTKPEEWPQREEPTSHVLQFPQYNRSPVGQTCFHLRNPTYPSRISRLD